MPNERPEATNRRCTICGATVAAWRDALVCHCYTMPWAIVYAQVGRNPKGQDPQGLGRNDEHAVPPEEAGCAQGEQP